jgi:hypothetical protein
MGLMDNIRGFFSSSTNPQTSQPQIDEEYEKSRLAEKIVNLIGKIKTINCFDSSIWNLSNTSSYELQRRYNLTDLKNLHSTLEKRLAELSRPSQRSNSNVALADALWTGTKSKDMTTNEFDRAQRFR